MLCFVREKVLIKILFCALLFFVPFVSFGSNHSLTSEEQKWLGENIPGQVFFSPTLDYPPFIWSEYGVLFGISNDYFEHIEQQIGFVFDRREARSLNAILEGSKFSEKNIISSISQTVPKSEYLLFTRPYISVPSVFVTKSGKPLTARDIINKNLTVSVADGYGAHEYLRDNFPSMKLFPENNNFIALQKVYNGQVDVAVIDVASLSYISKKHEMTGLRKAGDVGYIYDLAFAVPKDYPELRNILDYAIEIIPSEFHDSVLEKWGIDQVSGALLNSTRTTVFSGDFLFDTTDIILMCILFFNTIFLFYYIFVHHKRQDQLRDQSNLNVNYQNNPKIGF